MMYTSNNKGAWVLVAVLFAALLLLVALQEADALSGTFGSKSRYVEPEPGANAGLEAENRVHNCSYDAVFLIARHGSRWPTLKHVSKYETLRGVLAHLNWTHPFALNDEGLLTPHGEKEMRSLGARFRRAFASLFAKHPAYHPRKYEFRSSQVTRALQSATSFALGLFGADRAFAIESDSLDRDVLLRFHDICENYTRTKKALTPKLEHVMEDTLSKVRRRLGVVDEKFNRKHLFALWSACLFEATALDSMDGACSFFDLEDAKIMEYIKDVEDYWEKSHGQQLNSQMACVLVSEVLKSLEAKRSRFFFGHAETIMPVVAFLGFFKDVEHLGYDWKQDLEARKWRSGVVSPFAANVVFASKVCQPKDSQDTTKRFVEIRHNERAMDLSHLCSHEGESPKMMFACSFEAFKQSLSERVGGCNFKEMCLV